MDMADKLKEAFVRYTQLVRARVHPGARAREAIVSRDASGVLRLLAHSLEQSDEFCDLVTSTAYSLSDADHTLSESAARSATRSFFRRSRYYIDAFEKAEPHDDAAFDSYRAAFDARETEVRYLAPMEFVSFEKETMDFGQFQVRRFSAPELEAVLDHDVKSVFYPVALIDAGRLTDYWFVCVTERVPAPGVGNIILDLDLRVRVRYSDYRPAVESALQVLALYDWEAHWGTEHPLANANEDWVPFHVPFVLSADDDLLSHSGHHVDLPTLAPDLSCLVRLPVVDSSGKEIGDRPEVAMRLTAGETATFESFVRGMLGLLAQLGDHSADWPFLARALGYLLKAFSAVGAEQLLWHITTLEALVGDDAGPGLNERMANRIAFILASTRKRKRVIRDRFKEVYNLRSRLVHGDSFHKAYAGHLRSARHLARRVVLWFVHLLSELGNQLPDGEAPGSLATREDLIALLDLKQSARARIRRLIDIVPADFPHVPEWSD